MKQADKNTRYTWRIFAGCCALSFIITGLVLSTVGLFFSYISEELHLSMTQVALVITCMSAAIAASMPIAGKVIGKINIRAILSACVLICGGSVILNAVSCHIASFVALWICIGFSVPFLMGLSIPVLLGHWFVQKTGVAMGITSAVGGIGGAFFNLLAGRIIQLYGWRTTYVFAGSLVILVLLPFTLTVVKLKPGEAEIPYGYEGNNEMPMPPGTGKTMIGETCRPYRSLKYALIMVAYVMAAMIAGFHQLIPSHVVSLGYAISAGGFVMSGVLLGLAAGNFLMGVLIDRIGPIRAISIGCLLGTVGWVGLIIVPTQTLLFAGGLLIGIGQSVTQVGLPYAIRTIFGNHEYARIYGIIAGIGGIACASMAIVGGTLFDWLGSYKPLLAGLAVLYLLSATGSVSALILARKQ